MFRIARFKISMVMAMVMAFASFGLASAQNPAYTTSYITSVTYQNVGTGPATVNFAFFQQKTASPTNAPRTLPQGAGDSLFVGGLTGTEQLPENFLGSAVLSSNQPVVATAVQLPQSTTVKNRPLSNGFSSGNATVLLATVLKNQFNNSSLFSVQNADTGNIDITVKIFNADNPTAAPIELKETGIPQGAAKSYNMGTDPAITAATFNGSATVTAVKSGTTTPANIVASVMELGTAGSAINDAKAFEGVNGGGPKVFMATALCNVFGGTTTAYAVQNTGTTDAAVTVSYSSGKTEAATISGGAKKSFTGCTVNDAGFSGAATVAATGSDVVVIGKVFGGGLGTAFLGETAGVAKLALPYVRYCTDANFNAGSCQRVFLAIQNVSDTAVSNVQVKYLNKVGTVVGTQTIASIAGGAKGNSNASTASLASGAAANALTEFGLPASNPGGGFGGAVVVEGPVGSQLIAIARVQSRAGSTSVAEDFNGIPIE